MIMPKTPKKGPEIDEKEEEKPADATWEKDQKDRGYYYDDAHGYETFDPDSEDDDDSED